MTSVTFQKVTIGIVLAFLTTLLYLLWIVFPPIVNTIVSTFLGLGAGWILRSICQRSGGIL